MPRDPAPPLRILIDSREQTPWQFPAEDVADGRKIAVTVERGTLPTGDYSLVGHAGRHGEEIGIAIERKESWDEIARNFTKDRDRFIREWQRLACFAEACVIVCEPWSKIRDGEMRSRINPGALEASLIAASLRYGVPFLCAVNAPDGARLALDILRRHHECHDEYFAGRRAAKDHEDNEVAQITRGAFVGLQHGLRKVQRVVFDVLGQPCDGADDAPPKN